MCPNFATLSAEEARNADIVELRWERKTRRKKASVCERRSSISFHHIYYPLHYTVLLFALLLRIIALSYYCARFSR